MSFYKKTIPLIIWSIFFFSSVYAETYILKDGSRVVGKPIKEDTETIVVKTEQFGELTLQKSNIVRVEKEQPLIEETYKEEPEIITSDIGKKIASLIKKLVAGYKEHASSSLQQRTALAVIPFQASEGKLVKQQVGFAISELIADYLVEQNKDTFEIIERSKLEKVLAEQKLSLSGLISENSAIETGKMLAANILLVGSVSQVGGSYIANARLVDVNTGQVFAAESENLSVDEVQEEAEEYLNLPSNWAFYFTFAYVSLTQQKEAILNGTTSYTNISTFDSLTQFGYGLRFIFFDNIFFDFFSDVMSAKPAIFGYKIENNLGSDEAEKSGWYNVTINGVLGWLQDFGPGKIMLGAGVYGFQFGGSQKVYPDIMFGYEWKIKKRLVFGFKIHYLIGNTSISVDANESTSSNQILIPAINMSPWYFQVILLGVYL